MTVSWLTSLFIATGLACHAMEPPALESQVKAAFLLNFTKFVDWPAEAFAAADSPMAICVVGNASIGIVLGQMVEGESVGGRKVMVERNPADPSKSCQVLFIGKSEKEAPKLLASAGRTV